MEQRNCCGRKAIHHHRSDKNPHQSWSNLQRESALHHPPDRGRDPLFSRASGSTALAVVCTHSAELGFYHEFEHDLSIVCNFIYSSRLKAGVCQCVTHRTTEPTVWQFCSPKRCYFPSVFRGLSKRKDMSKDFFTMDEKNRVAMALSPLKKPTGIKNHSMAKLILQVGTSGTPPKRATW